MLVHPSKAMSSNGETNAKAPPVPDRGPRAIGAWTRVDVSNVEGAARGTGGDPPTANVARNNNTPAPIATMVAALMSCGRTRFRIFLSTIPQFTRRVAGYARLRGDRGLVPVVENMQRTASGNSRESSLRGSSGWKRAERVMNAQATPPQGLEGSSGRLPLATAGHFSLGFVPVLGRFYVPGRALHF